MGGILIKKRGGGLNSLCSGGGYMIKRVYIGEVVDVIVLTVRGECGRVNI